MSALQGVSGRARSRGGRRSRRQLEISVFVRQSTNRIAMFNCALATSDTWLKRVATIFIITWLVASTWSICLTVMIVMYVGLTIAAQCWIWRTPRRIHSLAWLAGFMSSFSWRETTYAPIPLPDDEWKLGYATQLIESGRSVDSIAAWHFIDIVLSRSSPLPHPALPVTAAPEDQDD